MSIPTFSNGDTLGSVRLLSLNPAIMEVNRLTDSVDSLSDSTLRTKAEAQWTTPIVIPTSPVNLIELLKATAPTSGSLSSPLIDLVSNKITPLNKDKTLMMKLSMSGSYGAGGVSADKAVLLSLTGGVTDAVSDFKGGGLFTNNDAVITIITMISVDKDGNATTLGVIPSIQSFVRTFTTNRIVLVIDQ